MYLKIPGNLLKIMKISWKQLKLHENLRVSLKLDKISLNSSETCFKNSRKFLKFHEYLRHSLKCLDKLLTALKNLLNFHKLFLKSLKIPLQTLKSLKIPEHSSKSLKIIENLLKSLEILKILSNTWKFFIVLRNP